MKPSFSYNSHRKNESLSCSFRYHKGLSSSIFNSTAVLDMYSVPFLPGLYPHYVCLHHCPASNNVSVFENTGKSLRPQRGKVEGSKCLINGNSRSCDCLNVTSASWMVSDTVQSSCTFVNKILQPFSAKSFISVSVLSAFYKNTKKKIYCKSLSFRGTEENSIWPYLETYWG